MTVNCLGPLSCFDFGLIVFHLIFYALNYNRIFNAVTGPARQYLLERLISMNNKTSEMFETSKDICELAEKMLVSFYCLVPTETDSLLTFLTSFQGDNDKRLQQDEPWFSSAYLLYVFGICRDMELISLCSSKVYR